MPRVSSLSVTSGSSARNDQAYQHHLLPTPRGPLSSFNLHLSSQTRTFTPFRPLSTLHSHPQYFPFSTTIFHLRPSSPTQAPPKRLQSRSSYRLRRGTSVARRVNPHWPVVKHQKSRPKAPIPTLPKILSSPTPSGLPIQQQPRKNGQDHLLDPSPDARDQDDVARRSSKNPIIQAPMATRSNRKARPQRRRRCHP